MIAAESPNVIAIVKNPELRYSLPGRPNDTFDTPRLVRHPRSESRLTVSSVTFAACASVLMLIVSASIMMSFLFIPYSAAVLYIRSASASLPSTVSGMPFSSIRSPTTRPPYFFASGNICSMTSRFAFTELIIGLPL